MSGRKKDPVWVHFIEEPSLSGKALRAKCKNCGKQIVGLVARMKKHLETCTTDDEPEVIDSEPDLQHSDTLEGHWNSAGASTSREAQQSNTQSTSSSPVTIPVKRKASGKLDTYIVSTTSLEKTTLNNQIARFIYGTNSAFRTVEHPEFIKMVTLLRPGYIPPSKTDIGGTLLEKIFKEEKERCSHSLDGQTVSMSLDGWSNVHNEPIISVSITTSTGETYFVDTIDTSGHSHTAEYLVEVAKAVMVKCEAEFKCHIQSCVTDNTGNVKKMRTELEKENPDLITYGCSAHLLNLLAHDLQIPNVKEQIVDIVKYFRNNHFASAKYRQEGGLKLVLPQDVRWNTMADCLSGYIKFWPILMKVCEENRPQIDNIVYNKVVNIGLKRSAEDLLKRLEPIAISLDVVQKNTCNISRAVHTWKKLETALREEKLDNTSKKLFSDRYKTALGPPHFLAYLLDPRYSGIHLTAEEKSTALLFAKNKYSSAKSFLPIIIKFQARASPFHNFLFEKSVVSEVSPLDWWKMHMGVDGENNDVMKCIEQLFTASASTASLERIFSTFGLVHSKLRNLCFCSSY